MSNFKKGVVLHYKDGSIPPQNPGTAAEYHQLKLQGFSERKPAGKQDSKTITNTGSKK